MVDTKIVARNVGIDEKALMMNQIVEMRSELKQLSEVISTQFSSGRYKTDMTSIIHEELKNNKSIEEITKDLVNKFNYQRQKDREELQAQLKANFAIIGEKFGSLKTSSKTVASEIFGFLSKEHKPIDPAAEGRTSIRAGFSGLSKLFSPEKFNSIENDSSQSNPNNDRIYDKISDSIQLLKKKDSGQNEKIHTLISSLASQNKASSNKNDLVDNLIKELDKTTPTKHETIASLTEKKKQEYIDRVNYEKKEFLADAAANKEIFKEKYLSKNIFGSLLSDATGFLSKEHGPIDPAAEGRKHIRGAFANLSKRFQPFLGQKSNGKDKGAPNTNSDKLKDTDDDLIFNKGSNGGTGEEILNTLHEMKSEQRAANAYEDDKLDAVGSRIKNVDDENDQEAASISSVGAKINRLSRYVRIDLIDDIITAIGKNKKEEDTPSGKKSIQLGGEDKENDKKSLWGSIFDLIKNKLGPMLPGLIGSLIKAIPVAALVAATGALIYETVKTVTAINKGKEDVRLTASGLGEQVAERNETNFSEDSEDVKKASERYTKAGLSQKQATAVARAERQNTKLTTSMATISGIFTAAKHSTDVRSSEKEMELLTEGEVLAKQIQLRQTEMANVLQEPEFVKKLTKKEVNRFRNEIKINRQFIADLNNVWNKAKTEAHGVFDSQWLKDKNLVSGMDDALRTLISSEGEIEKSFDNLVETTPELGVENNKSIDIQESVNFKGLSQNRKDIMMKARESMGSGIADNSENNTPFNKMNDNIKTIDNASSPTMSKISEDIKVSMEERDKMLIKEIKELKTEVANNKIKAIPVPMSMPPIQDNNFGNIQNISRGYN